jgi:putative flippase GtrA
MAGGIAAGCNFGSRFLFSRYVGYITAIVMAYLVGMMVAFVLMRGQVFNARGKRLLPQVLSFVFVNLLAVLQTVIISLVLVRCAFPFMGLDPWVDAHREELAKLMSFLPLSMASFHFSTTAVAEALAHLVGVLVPVVTSYFGHKFLTFR